MDRMKHKLKNTLVETYGQYAQDRDKSRTHEWKIQEQDRFMSLLKSERKRTVLEIGAGPGKMIEFFRGNGFTETDFRERILECRFELEFVAPARSPRVSSVCFRHILW